MQNADSFTGRASRPLPRQRVRPRDPPPRRLRTGAPLKANVALASSIRERTRAFESSYPRGFLVGRHAHVSRRSPIPTWAVAGRHTTWVLVGSPPRSTCTLFAKRKPGSRSADRSRVHLSSFSPTFILPNGELAIASALTVLWTGAHCFAAHTSRLSTEVAMRRRDLPTARDCRTQVAA